jgi:hypothetical protein
MGGFDDDDSKRYKKAEKAWETHVESGLIKAAEEVGQDILAVALIKLFPEVWSETRLFSLFDDDDDADDTVLWWRKAAP